MEIKAVNFDSWDDVKANISLLTGAEESEFKHARTIGKSFSKQLNSSLQFFSFKGNRYHVRILLGDDVFYYHPHDILDGNMERWKKDKKVSNPYDILCLIGFELLEILQRQSHSLESFMDKFEAEVLENPKKSQRADIIQLHGNAIKIKRQLSNYSQILIRHKQSSPLWDELIINLQSSLDDARSLVELIENIREAHQASLDNKANEIMKFLTVLATVFFAH
jgi:magnesium transporter